MSEFDDRVRNFCAERAIRALIAVSGTAEPNPLAEQIAHEFVANLRGHPVGIIISGTKIGVPGSTFRCARSFGIPVIRVFPEYAPARGHLHDGKADLEIAVPPRVGPSMWGDESGLFVKLASGIVFIGGGSGTLLEIATWAKVNKTLFGRTGATTIPAVPIALGDGWSDWLAREGHQAFHEFYTDATPSVPLESGEAAAIWLIEQFRLSDSA